MDPEKDCTAAVPPIADHWLAGPGETSALILSTDWSQTPLGPMSDWPTVLKSTLGICLSARFPMAIYWGRDLCLLYNDAWRPIVGNKHPASMGRPGIEVWPEIWDTIAPLFESVRITGEGTWRSDQLLPMQRFGYTEECYFDYTFNPIRGQDGLVCGILNIVQETTYRVLNDRRISLLRELAHRSTAATSAKDACEKTLTALATDRADVPFALLYLMNADRTYGQLVNSTGLPDESPARIQRIDLTSGAGRNGWPLALALHHMEGVLVEGLTERFGPIAGSFWPESTLRALMLPVTGTGPEVVAMLIVGVNPRRQLDDTYRHFLDSIRSQLAVAIAAGRNYEGAQKRSEALAELDRAKTAFFSNVSHEFRTPLTLMLGPLEDLLSKAPSDLSPFTKGQLELVNRNGLRLLRLVNTLLDFTRLEAGRVQASFKPTDLDSLTSDLASVFRSATERAGVRLVVDCSPIGEPVYVDRDMWEKIVLNLLSNAFKFTFEGSITVTLRRVNKLAELRVSDTGVGIAPEELPRLFERFHRVEHVRSRTHEGSGIGLALVQELIQLHGGSVRAESLPGKGTTFIVTVPLGISHLPADRISSDRTLDRTATGAAPLVEQALRCLPDYNQNVESTTSTMSRHDLLPIPTPPLVEDQASDRPYVLIADDNADMRQYIGRLLSERYRVETVQDGRAAILAAQNDRPDLIISDVMMPNLDGFGLLRELRSHPFTETIPVILLSARAGEESRVEGLEQGADDYLIKPFSARELLARVDAHIKMAQIRRDAQSEIARSKLFLERIAMATPDMLFVLDILNGRNIYINRSLETVLGYSVEQLQGIRGDLTEVLIHPEDREAVRLWYTGFDSVMDGSVLESEHRVLRADGTYTWILARATVFDRTADGRTSQIIGIATDITKRKLSEERLRASDLQLRLITDTAPVYIAHCDNDGRFLFVNKRYANRFGLKPSECLGKRIPDIVGEQAYASFQVYVKRALAGESVEFEMEVPYEALGPRYMHCAYVPQFDAGNVQGFVSVILDITERRQAEIGLRKSEEELRELAAQLEHLVETRTDELVQSQSRLRALATELNLTEHRERTKLAAELHDHLAQMLVLGRLKLGQGKRLTALAAPVADLIKQTDDVLCEALSYTRTLVADLSPPVLQEFGLAAALRWLATQMERFNLQVTVEIDNAGYPIPEDRAVLLFQSIRELLINVSKHAETNHAFVSLRYAEQTLRLEVRDEGQGFDISLRDGAASGSSKFGFFSIGERMKALGGQFSVESLPGKGTKAVLMLPLEGQDNAGHASVQDTAHVRKTNNLLPSLLQDGVKESRPIRVLLVDDHAMLRQGLRTIVTSYDHLEVVGEAADGLDAIELARKLEPDVIVMDINMPKLDGIEATRRIKESHQHMAIVGLSVHQSADMMQRLRDAGAVGYLTKESASNDLCKAIEEAARSTHRTPKI